jgi:hypothetical protein
MKTATFEVSVEVADYDEDLLANGSVPEMVRQRFDGTAIKLSYVKRTDTGRA